MKFLIIFCTSIISISISAIAIAGGDMFSDGRGEFLDDRWSISVGECGELVPHTYIKNDGKSLILTGNPKVTYKGNRKISTWSKAGTKYQAIWNAQDPRFVRLRVIGANGRIIANRLLKAGKYPPC